MNNRTWLKLQYSLLDDTRLKIVASKVTGSKEGNNEVLGIYLRLLKVFYKDYPEGIPWEPEVVEAVADSCMTTVEKIELLAEACTSPAVLWFVFVNTYDIDTAEVTGKKLCSFGAEKEIAYIEQQAKRGSEGGRGNKKDKP